MNIIILNLISSNLVIQKNTIDFCSNLHNRLLTTRYFPLQRKFVNHVYVFVNNKTMITKILKR